MARAAKQHNSKTTSSFRKWNSSLLLFAFLLLFSLTLLVLLSLGIVSINNSAPKTPHEVADLTSLKYQTDLHNRGQKDHANQRRGWREVLAWQPRAFIYDNFLADDECEYLIKLAEPHMRKSAVVDSTTGKSKDSRVRTSSGTFLQRGQDKIIETIEKRIADFTFIPVLHSTSPGTVGVTPMFLSNVLKLSKKNEHGEGLQVLHYEVGQKYEPHFDYFLDKFSTKNGGQRMATLLMYLSNVEEGGETMFPLVKVNNSSAPHWNEFSECGKTGLSVRPKKGDALLLWSMKPDATLDPMSLYGGCPVIKGNKWSSRKWMRVNEYKV